MGKEHSKGRGRNVLGKPLECCCSDPMTGFYRDGYCRLGRNDPGLHTVCTHMTAEFLVFSRAAGNDSANCWPMPTVWAP